MDIKLQCCRNYFSNNYFLQSVLSSVSAPDPGLQERSNMLNDNKIILFFSDFYNILSFN